MSKVYKLDNGITEAEIYSLGGTILSFKRKDSSRNAVLSFKHREDYERLPDVYLNAVVGRNANRIKNGRFRLNGREYELEVNNGPNNLHSGSESFSFHEFKEEEHTEDKLVLSHYAEDGLYGFPGNLNVKVTYRLVEDSLDITFEGKSDKDTLFNMTLHTYFNLNGGIGDILDEELYIPSEKMNLNDEDGLATDETLDVRGTAFDFTEYKKIGEAIRKGHENMVIGIDHNYQFENMQEKLMCKLRNEELELSVFSDLPGLQVYTSNFFKGYDGENGILGLYQGVALECQFCPNAVNYERYLKPVIKADERVSHHIRYKLEKRR